MRSQINPKALRQASAKLHTEIKKAKGAGKPLAPQKLQEMRAAAAKQAMRPSALGGLKTALRAASKRRDDSVKRYRSR